jgi:alpha-tubulin suppressor-like RCC1 family protein
VNINSQSRSSSFAPGPRASIAQAAIADSVLAWGWNEFGQTTVPVAAQSGVVAIASATHTVALKDDGSVVAWGNNNSGQTDVPIAAQSGDGDCGGILSHRSLEERRNGGGVGKQLFWPSDRNSNN